MKRIIQTATLIFLIIFSGQSQDKSLGTKIGENVKDAFEAVLPGGQLIGTIVETIFEKKNPKDSDNIKITAEELKIKLKETNTKAVQTINDKLTPIKKNSEQAAYFAKLHIKATECRNSYTAVLSKLIDNPSSVEVPANLKAAQKTAKTIGAIDVEEINTKYDLAMGTYQGLKKLVITTRDNSGFIEEVMKKDYQKNPIIKSQLAMYILAITNDGLPNLDHINAKVGLDLALNLLKYEAKSDIVMTIKKYEEFQMLQIAKTTIINDALTKESLQKLMDSRTDEELKEYFKVISSKEELKQIMNSKIKEN